MTAAADSLLRKIVNNARKPITTELSKMAMERFFPSSDVSRFWNWLKGFFPFYMTVRRLRESEEMFRLMSELSKVGIFQLDRHGNNIYANGEMSKISGLDSETLLAQSWLGVVHPDDKRRIADQFKMMIEHNAGHINLDCSLMLSDGSVKWVTGDVAPMHDAKKYLIGYLGTLSDISELKEAYDQLEQMAFYDTLTGLANRRLCRSRLEHMLSTMWRTDTGVALIHIDVDHFKRVNDTLGHDAGDALLTVISERLKHCVRFSDTAGRQGGDEFVVIMSNIHDKAVVIDTAEKILIALSEPVVYMEHTIAVSGSLGISMAPQDCLDAETLMKNADLATYKAKDIGRNNFQFFTPD